MTTGCQGCFLFPFSSTALLSNKATLYSPLVLEDGFRSGLLYLKDVALWEPSLNLERSPIRFITSGEPGPDLLTPCG